MKKVNKYCKRGFTLIEMLLAIAITMVISGLFITLIVAIKASYYRTYNDDDCADIAAMYAQALENQILYDIQNGVATDTISINSDSILTNTLTTHQITFDQIDNFNRAGTEQKWDIRMVCYFDSDTCEFRYKFYFIDLYVNPGYLCYELEGGFWIPYYAPFTNHNMGSGDEFDPASTGSYDWDYNVSSPTTDYSITITNEGTVDAMGQLQGASMTGGYFRRITNDGLGNMIGDGASDAQVPSSSSSVTITVS